MTEVSDKKPVLLASACETASSFLAFMSSSMGQPGERGNSDVSNLQILHILTEGSSVLLVAVHGEWFICFLMILSTLATWHDSKDLTKT